MLSNGFISSSNQGGIKSHATGFVMLNYDGESSAANGWLFYFICDPDFDNQNNPNPLSISLRPSPDVNKYAANEVRFYLDNHNDLSKKYWFCSNVQSTFILSYNSPNVEIIQSLYGKCFPSVPNQSKARTYFAKNSFFARSGSKYVLGTNTFTFMYEHGDLNISPLHEVYSAFVTKYSIQTSGMVIGENIESHAYKINTIGSNVAVIANKVDELEREVIRFWNIVNILQTEIESITSFIQITNMMSMVGGIVGMGIGVGQAIYAGLTVAKKLFWFQKGLFKAVKKE
jgi:hypothetical protein